MRRSTATSTRSRGAGTPVSAATVSRVAKARDAAVEAFHRRPLADRYRVLMPDGVVLKRKIIGCGAIRRSVLVALELTPPLIATNWGPPLMRPG